MNQRKTYQLNQIGIVRIESDKYYLEIFEDYKRGLKNLEKFSHVNVLWWADKADNDESRRTIQCYSRYSKNKKVGVFACRSPHRPNPIALTTCHILEINEKKGIVKVSSIDAQDKSPIIDLKAYIPVCDKVKEVKFPKNISEWPDWWAEK
jgi:tRNA-Thr(GGU) m(6)t(6)A37 methyltransferase TsaA